jgi:hypothetical protein
MSDESSSVNYDTCNATELMANRCRHIFASAYEIYINIVLFVITKPDLRYILNVERFCR